MKVSAKGLTVVIPLPRPVNVDGCRCGRPHPLYWRNFHFLRFRAISYAMSTTGRQAVLVPTKSSITPPRAVPLGYEA